MTDDKHPLDMTDEELTTEIREHHTPEADATEAYELLEEVVSLWDDLDQSGRVSRMRQASQILTMSLDDTRTLNRREDNDAECLDCGCTERAAEAIGDGRTRFYCPDCDKTHQV